MYEISIKQPVHKNVKQNRLMTAYNDQDITSNIAVHDNSGAMLTIL